MKFRDNSGGAARVKGVTFFLLFTFLLLNFGAISPGQAASCTTTSTNSGGYIYVAFKTAGTTCEWTIPEGVTAADFLVVGGGGGGGMRHAGGGGAGGLVKQNSVSLSNITSIQIKVGSGGNGRTSSTSVSSGETSTVTKYAGTGTLNAITAVGGGAGGTSGALGSIGGSGGGSYNNGYVDGTYSGVAGTAGQGNAGGTGGYGRTVSMWASGGGGGAGSAGGNASHSVGGAGGDGTSWVASFTSSIATALGLTDTSTFFAGGGGGGITLASGTTNGGAGGSGGGGAGGGGGTWSSLGPTGAKGANGIANTGGGGGGSGLQQGQGDSDGGSGGSGIVMIRYLIPTATLGSPTYSGTLNKGTLESMTVTSNVSGKVRFYIAGKRISNCLSVSTTSSGGTISATCTWKPAVGGSQQVYAVIFPTDSLISSATSGMTSVNIQRRLVAR